MNESESEDQAAYQRFEDLTRKLLAVPKAEVEALNAKKRGASKLLDGGRSNAERRKGKATASHK